jgi:hypothetical protein
MMKRIFVAVAVASIAFMVCSCSQEGCLKKYGYTSCDHLSKALNLQDNDEALKFHSICKECGCPGCK